MPTHDTETLAERQRVAEATENDMALVAAIHNAICTKRRPHGDCDEPDYNHTATHAAASVLASDWLAARDAVVAAQAKAEALQEVRALADKWEEAAGFCSLHRRPVYLDHAADIRRAVSSVPQATEPTHTNKED